MRHLAARFIPKIGEQSLMSKSTQFQFNLSPVHVVDPNLDFRDNFKNFEKLRENLEKRKMFDLLSNLPKIQDDYFRWLKAYINFSSSAVDKKDVSQRDLYFVFRGELLKHSEGLLAALSLPNSLDAKQSQQFIQRFDLKNYEEDLDEILQNVRSDKSSALFLRDLRSSLLKFVKKSLKPSPIPISGPFLVRPALVECCNIDLNEFPLITDGIDSPFCLVGTHIPSFLSVLVNGLISSLNDWPISLLASGPIYQRSSTNSKQFNQSERISILTLGRNEDECTKRQMKICEIFSAFLQKFLQDEVKIYEKQPERLQLWERSSTIFVGKINESDDEIIQIASFSNIGDYISRRAHVTFNSSNKKCAKNDGKEDGNKNNDQNYVQMAFATIDLDYLSNDSKYQKVLNNT